MPAKCQHCGEESNSRASFCGHCGRPLKREASNGGVKRFGLGASLVAVILVAALATTGVLGGQVLPWQQGSSTKTFEIAPAEGLTIRGDQALLEDGAEFKAYLVNDQEFDDLNQGFMGSEYLPLNAYEIDAGLADDERLAGQINYAIDLRQLGIPEAMWSDIGLVRVGDDGSIKRLHTELDGASLSCYSRQNSYLVAVLVGSAIGLPIFTAIDRMNLGLDDVYKNTNFYYTDDVKGYTLLWPETMAFGNPQEVEKIARELDAVFSDYGIDIREGFSENLVRNVGDEASNTYRESLLVFMNRLYKDEEYIRIREIINTKDWQRRNVWPASMQSAAEVIELVDDYLFAQRGFVRPSHNVLIGLLDIWPHGAEVLGVSENPYTAAPYMHINISRLGKKSADDVRQSLLVTVAHELFHIVQSDYVDFDDEAFHWFWEATAVMLEQEAIDYFSLKGVLSGNVAYKKTDSRYYETFINSLGYPNFWLSVRELDTLIQNQGYTGSHFLDYMRDQYAGSERNHFLPRLLKQFAKDKEWEPAVLNLLKIDSKTLSNDYLEFSLAYAKEIHDRVVFVAADPQHDYYYLVANQAAQLQPSRPVAPIRIDYRPLSSTYRFLYPQYNESIIDKMHLVIRTRQEDILEGRVRLRATTDGARTFIDVDGDDYTAIGEVQDLSYLAVQEVQTNTVWGESGQYETILMLRPAEPGLTIESGALLVSMPEPSALRQEGIVSEYLVTAVDPTGEVHEYYTASDELEIALSDLLLAEDSPQQICSVSVTEVIHRKDGSRIQGPTGFEGEITLDVNYSGYYAGTVLVYNAQVTGKAYNDYWFRIEQDGSRLFAAPCKSDGSYTPDVNLLCELDYKSGAYIGTAADANAPGGSTTYTLKFENAMNGLNLVGQIEASKAVYVFDLTWVGELH